MYAANYISSLTKSFPLLWAIISDSFWHIQHIVCLYLPDLYIQAIYIYILDVWPTALLLRYDEYKKLHLFADDLNLNFIKYLAICGFIWKIPAHTNTDKKQTLSAYMYVHTVRWWWYLKHSTRIDLQQIPKYFIHAQIIWT